MLELIAKRVGYTNQDEGLINFIVSRLATPASTARTDGQTIARNWDEQCKATNVVGTVTWHCQWKVHNDGSHYFGNPTDENESENKK